MGRNALKPYIIAEQEYFSGTAKNELKEMGLDFEKAEKEVKFLGLSPFDYSVSYYIGVDWLEEIKSYIVVKPKINGLDYIRMFMHCLGHPEIYKYLKDIYHIDFTRSCIQLDSEEWELTPFLIVHFLFLLDRVSKHGLKRNYIFQNENLKSKIKGKVLFSNHMKRNIAAKREDRIYCNYQDYSTDCPENRILKRALLFIKKYASPIEEKYPELSIKKNRLLACFEHVSDEISPHEINRLKLNPIYKDYSEAIEIAKLILKRFGYSYANISTVSENKLPPFWIDMSKLFELFVYSKLKEAYPKIKIEYQVHGKYGYVDFLDLVHEIIIDTKYKLCYAEEKYKSEDIRQLSGYARDRGVLRKLGHTMEESQDKKVIDCVIVAPDEKADKGFIGRNLICNDHKIKQFTRFYWCGIRLPQKGDV